MLHPLVACLNRTGTACQLLLERIRSLRKGKESVWVSFMPCPKKTKKEGNGELSVMVHLAGRERASAHASTAGGENHLIGSVGGSTARAAEGEKEDPSWPLAVGSQGKKREGISSLTFFERTGMPGTSGP